MLFGIGLVFTFNALIALLQIVASQATLQQLTFWMLGSLSGIRWPTLWPLMLLAVPLILWSLAAAPGLTALRLGDERARSLGLDVRRIRLMVFLRVSLMTGAAVATCGSIGFVGLVGPHIARLLVGEDRRIFLPVSTIAGGLILLAASLAAKLVVPALDVPTGITTALIGLPVFCTDPRTADRVSMELKISGFSCGYGRMRVVRDLRVSPIVGAGWSPFSGPMAPGNPPCSRGSQGWYRRKGGCAWARRIFWRCPLARGRGCSASCLKRSPKVWN